MEPVGIRACDVRCLCSMKFGTHDTEAVRYGSFHEEFPKKLSEFQISLELQSLEEWSSNLVTTSKPQGQKILWKKCFDSVFIRLFTKIFVFFLFLHCYWRFFKISQNPKNICVSKKLNLQNFLSLGFETIEIFVLSKNASVGAKFRFEIQNALFFRKSNITPGEIAWAVNQRRNMIVGGYNSCQWVVFKNLIGWEPFRGTGHMCIFR